MSRKIIPILAASLLAAASMSGVAYAKGGGNGGGNGGGHGGGHGSADHGGGNGHGGTSGHGKQSASIDHGKSGSARGHLTSAERSAKAHSEHVKQASKHADDDVLDDDEVASIDDTEDEDETAATGKLNFGTVISSIRAGKMDLTGIDETTSVNVVDVAGLIKGANHVALENALADNEDEITTLHDDLTTLGLTALQTEDINDVVAVSRAKDGSLTVFVDHSE